MLLIVIIFTTWYHFDTKISIPAVDETHVKELKRVSIGPDHYQIGNNWLKKNAYGLWEMYLEGPAFERGVISGKLTEELIYKQEKAFIDKIKEMIPSTSYLKFLKYFIRFFNRDIDEYILLEYQKEIYGISFSASDEFNFIGTKYERMLNYHAAHDIGHALQDLMLVGCTSFAANMGYPDSSMIIGRNFDFYVSDEFAEDKIVCFVRPVEGYPFTFITWASMIGVVSGMNNNGLTVTINAGKSEIPYSAATPISLIAREILQYAASIDEAIDIAEKRKSFVSESLLIGSAKDNRAIIIEKSPSKFGIYEIVDSNLICANHFQSEAFKNDEANKKQIAESASLYRQNRVSELIKDEHRIDYKNAAYILRDRYGMGEQPIGLGNEKAMAQLISHHSVIFQPLIRDLWVSTKPYQLGEYLNYNLTDFFNKKYKFPLKITFDSLYTIPQDPFINTVEFNSFISYKKERNIIKNAIENNTMLDDQKINSFIALNPGYFEAYVLAGDYFMVMGNTEKALHYFKLSLSKEFERKDQEREVFEKIKSIKKN
jgi:hypothetical protein